MRFSQKAELHIQYKQGGRGRQRSLSQWIAVEGLPQITYRYFHKIVSIYLAREMNRQYAEVMQHYLFVIDDIGREESYQEYGNRFNVLPDLVDDCERRGKLLITTTNCTTAEMAEKYGERTISRLKATTRLVVFAGEDLRHA